MQNSSELMVSTLLGDVDKNTFIENGEGNRFASNFRNTERLRDSGNNILIKQGSVLILEGERIPEFSTILLEGTLKIRQTNEFPLKVQKIIIAPTGRLIIGTDQQPITPSGLAEIIFVRKQLGEIGIFVFGELIIHGHNIGPTFVELVNDAKAGDQILAVDHSVRKWNKGDRIVITSPGYTSGVESCTEESEVLRVEGTFVFTKEPLKCFHRGGLDNNNVGISSYAAILSRNVVIGSEDHKNRGSVNFFHGSKGSISYAEFRDLGPKNTLGRYPIHFHHMEDTSRGMQVIGNSIVNSDNRWITVHDSNGIIIKNNVGYRSVGHGFFLEDGTEFENIYENNIGIKASSGDIIPSDAQTAIFWTQNPYNIFRDNIAVEGLYYGYYFSIPHKKVKAPGFEDEVNLRSFPTLIFDNNIAFNNRHSGLKIDRLAVTDERIKSPNFIISNFLQWNDPSKNVKHQEGIRISGTDIIVTNSKLVDNRIGIGLFGDRITVKGTEITHYTEEYHPPIAGIMIGGHDNEVVDSTISGYISRNGQTASDIAVSNFYYHEQIISASIINTELLDPKPIMFGNPINIDSYLEVYGYNAPNSHNESYPKNFVIKRIEQNEVKTKEKKSNIANDFVVVIEPIDVSNKDLMSKIQQVASKSLSKSEQIKIFKNKAGEWKENIITSDKFLNEVKILIESDIIYIPNLDPEDIEDINFITPTWITKLIGFWGKNAISDREFIDALEYILQSQMVELRPFYN